MKVGLIVECGPGGLERVVCPKIIALLAAECKLTIDAPRVRTMSGKRSLILECAAAARALFSDGCDRVLIVWDEDKPWTEEEPIGDERCWHHEREGILERLRGEPDVPLERIGLICVEHEFETILMHDGDLLRSVVPRSREHPAKKLKTIKHPLAISHPAKWLDKKFREGGRPYNKVTDAKKFAANLKGLDALKQCDIFRHLIEKTLGYMPQGWAPYVYIPRGPRH